jgi:hypothetical protein
LRYKNGTGGKVKRKRKKSKLGLSIPSHYGHSGQQGKIVNAADRALLVRRKQITGDEKHVIEPASTLKTSQSAAQAITFKKA